MGTSVPGTPTFPAPQLPAEGGEPACLLHLVCDACGSLETAREAHGCPQCGAPRADGDDGNPGLP
ncbi:MULTISPECIES: hypothetical protein [unclassified Streptomyces]|uniref:hypothetical protein n=1 Tax=unclassified Streptomyces TaxID=2593676 RepID=UPI002E2BE345|nr:hypothetical protein [Streptomyces sp. NBC_01439]